MLSKYFTNYNKPRPSMLSKWTQYAIKIFRKLQYGLASLQLEKYFDSTFFTQSGGRFSFQKVLLRALELEMRRNLLKIRRKKSISQITIDQGLIVICEFAQFRYFTISLFHNFANYNKPSLYRCHYLPLLVAVSVRQTIPQKMADLIARNA